MDTVEEQSEMTLKEPYLAKKKKRKKKKVLNKCHGEF